MESKETGIFLTIRGIDEDKELIIVNPIGKLSEIAAEVGFESNSYFSTVFKKLDGLSPN